MSDALTPWLIGGIFAGVSALLLTLAYDAWRLKITPTPSGRQARALLTALCAQTLETQRKVDKVDDRPQVFDLGAGWGGLCLSVSRALNREGARCEVIGYELGRAPYHLSRISLALSKFADRGLQRGSGALDHCELRRGDLIEALSQARAGDVLLCYLCPEQMQRIADELRVIDRALGVTLISLVFALPEQTPHAQERLSGVFRDPIYVYKI